MPGSTRNVIIGFIDVFVGGVEIVRVPPVTFRTGCAEPRLAVMSSASSRSARSVATSCWPENRGVVLTGTPCRDSTPRRQWLCRRWRRCCQTPPSHWDVEVFSFVVVDGAACCASLVHGSSPKRELLPISTEGQSGQHYD